MERLKAYAALLLVAGALLAVVPLAVSGGGVKWLTSITGTSLPIGAPETFKAYAYDPSTLRNYTVSCNITVTNGTDVVLMDRFSGSPAVYSFTFWKPGLYSVSIHCVADGVGGKNFNFNVEYHYPAMRLLDPNPPWGRFSTLVVEAEYPYNETVHYVLNGVEGSAPMRGGRLEVNATLTEPAVLTVYFHGKRYDFNVTPRPPRMAVEVEGEPLACHWVSVRGYLYDDEGPVPANYTVHYRVYRGGTVYYESTLPAGRPLRLRLPAPGPYTVEASTPVMGVEVSASKSFTVPAPTVGLTLRAARVNPWLYAFRADASTSYPVNGTLWISVDGYNVTVVHGFNETLEATAVAELDPGVHVVKAVYYSPCGARAVRVLTLRVPRHEYPYQPPRHVEVPYGADWRSALPKGFRYYVWNATASRLYVVAYYPGDSYYLPKKAIVVVDIYYPVITANETHVHVEKGWPGALVSIYCSRVSGPTVLVYQAVMRGHMLDVSLPDYNCTAVRVVYELNGWVLYVEGNNVEPVPHVDECMAGAPCTPVPASPLVRYVLVGDRVVRAGEPVRLPAGVYRVVVHLVDNTTVAYTLHVDAPHVAVLVSAADPREVTVEGPPGSWVVLVLADGRRVAVGPGHYRLPAPVSAAFNPYYGVEVESVWVLPG